MAYSTKSDILLRLDSLALAELTDDSDNDELIIVDAVLNANISQADNLINSYLRGKHSLPIDVVSVPRIKDISVLIAIYNLHTRRGEATEGVESRYKMAIQELKDIRDGKILINDPDGAVNNGSLISVINHTSELDTNSSGTGALDCYFNGPI